MKVSVYKTPEGQKAVEGYYRNILASFSSNSGGSVPFEQLFIPTAAGKTHLIRSGKPGGPALVFLHGSMSNSAAWLGNLRDFTDDFYVHCIDIPGEPGLSEPQRMSLASAGPAEWLSSVLDELGIGKAGFIGMSLGSRYALAFAGSFPERISALSMITASGLAPQRKSFMLKALICMLTGASGKKRLNRIVYHKTAVPPEVFEFQDLVSRHFKPVMETVPLLSDRELSGFRMPVQYFGGDHDALLDSVKSAARLKSLVPQAETHILENTGHVIIDRFPDIRAFFEQIRY